MMPTPDNEEEGLTDEEYTRREMGSTRTGHVGLALLAFQ
jgi:hypothetical protein